MGSSPPVTFRRPAVTPAEARVLARSRFGLEGKVRELPSERDRNFLIESGDGAWVLKLAHADEAPEVLDLQHRSLERIAERASGLAVPQVRRSLAGHEVEPVETADGTRHLARVLSWVPGRVWATVSPHTPRLLRSLGSVLGRIDAALDGFSHRAARRELKWDLTRPEWTRSLLGDVADPTRRALAERHLDRFEREVRPALDQLRRGVIHNDANDWNVIVAPGHPYQRDVAGLVDFGDLLETAVVAELAIGCAYAMQGKPDPLGAAVDVVAGYHAAHPLSALELALLFPLICTRLAVSVINAAHQRTIFPDNQYLLISERPAWDTLERLEEEHPRLAHYAFRAAAGLEAVPSAPAVVSWLQRNRSGMDPLLDGLPSASLTALDLSGGSTLIETPEEPEDVAAFGAKLAGTMADRGATVGVGRYGEARLLYTRAGYEAQGNERPMPRTVHLGLDLFAPAATAVLAPLPGVVAAVRDNGMDRDYGPTVILRHDADGVPFHTLYGHLGRDCLAALQPGQTLARGDRIGTIGADDVNGGWPPHLHFQLVTDLLDRDGEFPGVARADRRAVWQGLLPDPNLVARLPAPLVASPERRSEAILESRRQHLGPSLSISYRRPLTIVRGWKQFLYDADGLRYLDAVNNVPHVGHCHPRVVRAAREQMAVLNTNTRYLHERLVEYAERLTATLPEPLRVCYLVNSGSEANELAIRLARVATGRRGMVVVDVGYHGNTTTLVDVSPYKHDGPGGRGAPPWVRKIPMPDDFRGAFRRNDPDAGPKYAAAVSDAVAALEADGEPAAAFLAESILSCGGQVVLPPGFLAEAYRRIRAAGGVAIADEVQVGFGRVGTHFWAFETQRVVPDIVTLGKPIGNGHPLGAVVTTPAIARAFANGMEFFSTFGGNPVSCAAGLAVLDVLAEEGLQAQALAVGAHLLEGLQGLVARHPVAGDARGLGLFVGLELVRDRATLEPAREEASYVANRLRDRGILVSTDGPFANVLKFKPPLCFDSADADQLVAALDAVLGEDFLTRGC